MALGFPHSAAPLPGFVPADVYQPALRDTGAYHSEYDMGLPTHP